MNITALCNKALVIEDASMKLLPDLHSLNKLLLTIKLYIRFNKFFKTIRKVFDGSKIVVYELATST